ncbi:putative cytosolic protein [Granulibacter bethesdensis]|uniref:Cytosolic protein n=1 Tax=Granulibacter bethesdensis TaxID=364410 RepID=A0AAC9K7Z7_9PROT|nr:circularly permuted type 2 ATP-grasp protein [Granulibacter bethesdensis]APH53591.1 putative cytosolic protein [Granulibacter bethesdensis]APH61169.1 putative cytosolic protein [Granulibacter bethesdensis]
MQVPLTVSADSASHPDPFLGYDPGQYFCELTTHREGGGQAGEKVRQRMAKIGLDNLRQRAAAAENDLINLGITFTVYSEATAIDRILPFDCIPRIITSAEWAQLEAGVKQRVTALNAFLHDVYHEQHILNDGTIPRDLVLGNSNYRPEMEHFPIRFGTYAHICGIDIVRDESGAFRVLEDNARTPSGVSYVIENRHLMLRAFPDLMAGMRLRPVDDYGHRLREAMAEIAPEGVDDPQVVLLSPGIYNSAYFEHVFLAREMGVPLVEGADLTVENDRVYMRTTAGLKMVHTIYRRIGDDFLDPTVFRPESLLGVAGLIGAWRKGNVTLANAVGTGVADDKAIYAYMPRIIRYYLNEDPILSNVDTHICREKDGLAYTLDNLDRLVVKPVGESGGYGITIGPRATREELDHARAALLADPANWISQPVVNLSVAPTLTPAGIQPRHLDLRPFAVTGRDTWVLPGGLSRVAMKAGSLVVNSSQGGGSKDTWVLEDPVTAPPSSVGLVEPGAIGSDAQPMGETKPVTLI